jgi:MFS family permease
MDRSKQNVLVLVGATAFLGMQLPMIFTIGGLAGQQLASNPCLATLPITATVLGSTLAARPMSAIMQKYGRRVGFWIGTTAAAFGSAIAAYGLYADSFTVFILGSLLIGLYQSANGFFRFAAMDTAAPEFRAKAVSWVMAGGLFSAFFGPQLVKWTSDASVVPFLGSYVTVIAINLLGSLLFLGLDIPIPAPAKVGAAAIRTTRQILADPKIRVAMIVGMVSYALMNLVMTSTPLAVVGCGFQKGDAANIVSGHVFAMFAPSFFTGHLITRFGVTRIMATGLAILTLSGLVALAGVELMNFYVALILLGIGWNFGFIGATTLLASAHRPEERGRVQGLNDMIVFGFVTIASLSSGGLMNCSGGTPQAGWAAVNLAMIPALALAGGALIWLAMQPKSE